MGKLTHTVSLFLVIFNTWSGNAQASLSTATATNANPQYTKIFTFDGLTDAERNRQKAVVYDNAVASVFVTGEKPKGLHKTMLDLDFPQITTQNSTIYRIVQFMLNGEVTEMQRELYKDMELKLSGSGEYSGNTNPCKVDLVVKVTKPSPFKQYGFFTPEVDGVEKTLSLNKNETKVVKFENVFGDDIPMDHFWVHFKVRGRCNIYMHVELVKPNNVLDSLN